MKKFKTKSQEELKKVLYGVLVVCLIVWIIVFIQVNLKIEWKNKSIPQFNQNELTQNQRAQAISELKDTVAKSSPITDKQRAQAIAELRKVVMNQNK